MEERRSRDCECGEHGGWCCSECFTSCRWSAGIPTTSQPSEWPQNKNQCRHCLLSLTCHWDCSHCSVLQLLLLFVVVPSLLVFSLLCPWSSALARWHLNSLVLSGSGSGPFCFLEEEPGFSHNRCFWKVELFHAGTWVLLSVGQKIVPWAGKGFVMMCCNIEKCG